jgi:predicted enzyme related to lactoylglutathione lyase
VQEAAMSGRVVHFELPVDDVERAGGFYRDAFGWQVQPRPDMGYALVSTTPTDETGAPTAPGAINGGMLLRRDPLTAPVITIEVDDIDVALERVATLGGRTALGRQAVGAMGFSAYVTDPEGNLVGLWQNA